jgi:hypothetical protein
MSVGTISELLGYRSEGSQGLINVIVVIDNIAPITDPINSAIKSPIVMSLHSFLSLVNLGK